MYAHSNKQTHKQTHAPNAHMHEHCMQAQSEGSLNKALLNYYADLEKNKREITVITSALVEPEGKQNVLVCNEASILACCQGS